MHNDFERFIVQGIFSFAEYARIETFIFVFDKNLIVNIFRLAVLFYEFDDIFNFGIGHKGPLYAHRERNFRTRVQHIALTQKFFRADLIDDNAAVHFRSDHKRNAAGNVRLYKTGNNVDRRTLGRQYQMNTDGAAHCGKAGYRRFKLFPRSRHKVGKFVNNQYDVRKLFRRNFALDDAFIVTCNVAYTHAVEQRIAAFHFTQTILQSLKRFFRLGNNGRKQMGNIVIQFKLDDFRVD